MNDQAQQAYILEGSLYLTKLVSYYARIKTFYNTRPSKAVAFLQEKIIDVCVAILKYSIKLRQILDQGNLCWLLLHFTLYPADLQPV